MTLKVIFISFLICFSYQTDIVLQPFDYEQTTFDNAQNSTESPSTTTQRTLTAKEKCLTTLNTTTDDLDVNTTSGENAVFVRYLSCYWKNKHLLGKNGKINFYLLEELINHAVKVAVDITDVPLLNAAIISTEIMEECKQTNGITHGEKAVKMRNCMYRKLLYQRSENFTLNEYEDIPYLELSEESCVNELKLDALEIEDMNRRYIVRENIADFENFLECYWKDADYMDQNGTLNISNLQLKLSDDIEFEFLSRSRAAYLTDVLTKSILKPCKSISGSNDNELIFNIYQYIIKRLPYFNVILFHG